MIFYFTGTGNSLHAAKYLQQEGEALVFMKEGAKIPALKEKETIGFVFPVYFYTVPKVVEEFICSLDVKDPCYCYAVITCGGGTQQASHVLKKLLAARGITLSYAREVVMPDNSMLFYQIPGNRGVAEKIAAADRVLQDIKKDIAARKEEIIGSFTWISDLLARGYALSMKTAKFYADDTCVHCGLCASICPEQAIAMTNGKPKWVKETCGKCSACINRCPVHALQYGKSTKRRNRYVHPDLKNS